MLSYLTSSIFNSSSKSTGYFFCKRGSMFVSSRNMALKHLTFFSIVPENGICKEWMFIDFWIDQGHTKEGLWKKEKFQIYWHDGSPEGNLWALRISEKEREKKGLFYSNQKMPEMWRKTMRWKSKRDVEKRGNEYRRWCKSQILILLQQQTHLLHQEHIQYFSPDVYLLYFTILLLLQWGKQRSLTTEVVSTALWEDRFVK